MIDTGNVDYVRDVIDNRTDTAGRHWVVFSPLIEDALPFLFILDAVFKLAVGGEHVPRSPRTLRRDEAREEIDHHDAAIVFQQFEYIVGYIPRMGRQRKGR